MTTIRTIPNTPIIPAYPTNGTLTPSLNLPIHFSTTTAAYANYQNNYKTGTANKKKETAQTTENTKLKENTTESIAEKNLSKAAQKMLENLRGSRNDMDFMVADFENGEL